MTLGLMTLLDLKIIGQNGAIFRPTLALFFTSSDALYFGRLLCDSRGWQTSDHLLVNRGFKSHMGYLVLIFFTLSGVFQ